jgi:hypothetical protein
MQVRGLSGASRWWWSGAGWNGRPSAFQKVCHPFAHRTWPTSAEPTPCSPTTPSTSSTAALAAPINRLSVTALLAASTENKALADEQAARTAIAEETANATD